jgi:hypothetical protein
MPACPGRGQQLASMNPLISSGEAKIPKARSPIMLAGIRTGCPGVGPFSLESVLKGHAPGAGAAQSLLPGHRRGKDAWTVEMPNRVVAKDLTGGARQDGLVPKI